MSVPVSPVVILVEPTLSENMGAVARAMLNFQLTELRLVHPKADWLNERARALAADADAILEQARAFNTFQEAIQDLTHLYGTTARPRDMNVPVMTPRQAAQEITRLSANPAVKAGLVFGSEKCGLDNEVLALVTTAVTVPLNPDFSSINLAQSVILCAYEIFQAQHDQPTTPGWEPLEPPAPREELMGFFEHLESELDRCGYLRVPHKRPKMVQTLRTLFARAALTSQEIRSLRGVISSLVNPNGIFSRPRRQKDKKVAQTD